MELIKDGVSSTLSFFAVTLPLTGEYTSLAALTLSKAPHSSFCFRSMPISGNWAKTTSPRASWAYEDMPTVPAAPSKETHSCFSVKRRSTQEIFMFCYFHVICSFNLQ